MEAQIFEFNIFNNIGVIMSEPWFALVGYFFYALSMTALRPLWYYAFFFVVFFAAGFFAVFFAAGFFAVAI